MNFSDDTFINKAGLYNPPAHSDTYKMPNKGRLRVTMDDGTILEANITEATLDVNREQAQMYSPYYDYPASAYSMGEQVTFSAKIDVSDKTKPGYTVTKRLTGSKKDRNSWYIDLDDPSLDVLKHAMFQTGATEDSSFLVESLEDGTYRFSWEV